MNFWKELPKPFSVLAPMEDVTDVVFRQVVAKCGRPDVFFTEFTSADGMNSEGREQVVSRLKKLDSESPIVAQIWGVDPENYYKAAKDIAEMGFDGVDINMGCPVKKIVKQGVCSALIDNPTLASEVIAATIEGAGGKIAVSVKTRIGYKQKKTEEWGEFLLDQNIQALTVHGRVAKEMSKYPADWDEIAKVVNIRNEKAVETVIIGNGDVESNEEISLKHEQYDVDGVMIGRGIFKDIFIFNRDKSFSDLILKEKLDLLLFHVELFEKTWGERSNFHALKRFFKVYVSGFDGASELRQKLMESESLDDVKNIISDL